MYQRSGVYIEHASFNAMTIEAASTSITAFIGQVRRGAAVTKSSGTPTFITSSAQYTTLFGPGDGSAGGVKNLSGSTVDLFGLAINAYFANGGTQAYIVPVQGAGGAKATAQIKISGTTKLKSVAVSAKDKGSWANNLMVSMSSDNEAKTFDILVGTWTEQAVDKKVLDQVIERFTGFDWEVGNGNAATKLKAAIDLATSTVNKGSTLIDIAFGAGVSAPSVDKTETDITENGVDAAAPAKAQYTQALGRLEDYRDVSIIVLPDIIPDSPGKIIYKKAIGHSEKMQNRMVIIDPGDATIISPKDAKTALEVSNSSYAAFYYPRVNIGNPHFDAELAPDEPRSFAVGPAAVVAGLWARIDGTRGVWKAPAGLEATVRGAFGPERLVDSGVQDNLNEWSVNCLRSITGPTVIWGARTTATKAKPEYRYISVRRTQNMIGESLYSALQAVVFEPNDHKLWDGLRASVGNFMDGLHRSGAFQGEKASDAYFVNCGLGSTMTQADIDAGIVRVSIGFAPLKPAEFVVVQISKKVGQTA